MQIDEILDIYLKEFKINKKYGICSERLKQR